MVSVIIKMHIFALGSTALAFAGFESLKTIQTRVQNLLSTLVLANEGLYL